MNGTEQNMCVGVLSVPFSTAKELTLFTGFIIKTVENLTVQVKNHGNFCAFFFLMPGSIWDHFNVCYCTFSPFSFFIDLQPYAISEWTYCTWFFVQMLATSLFPVTAKFCFFWLQVFNHQWAVYSHETSIASPCPLSSALHHCHLFSSMLKREIFSSRLDSSFWLSVLMVCPSNYLSFRKLRFEVSCFSQWGKPA